MKKYILLVTLLLPALGVAEDELPPAKEAVTVPRLQSPQSDTVVREVETISTNGSITRASCPHTCEDRGLPVTQCKTWTSENDPSKCYVMDTTKPTEAIKFD
jgi:hypothetical protein